MAIEQGLLAIRLIKFALNTNSSSLEMLGSEDLKDIKKAWQLSKKILNSGEMDSFKNTLRHYAD